jgi:hypothetical protein
LIVKTPRGLIFELNEFYKGFTKEKGKPGLQNLKISESHVRESGIFVLYDIDYLGYLTRPG